MNISPEKPSKPSFNYAVFNGAKFSFFDQVYLNTDWLSHGYESRFLNFVKQFSFAFLDNTIEKITSATLLEMHRSDTKWHRNQLKFHFGLGYLQLKLRPLNFHKWSIISRIMMNSVNSAIIPQSLLIPFYKRISSDKKFKE